MQTLGKLSFVLAPICLFAGFFSSAVLQNTALRSVFIVAATIFLIFALIAKAVSARRNTTEEDNP